MIRPSISVLPTGRRISFSLLIATVLLSAVSWSALAWKHQPPSLPTTYNKAGVPIQKQKQRQTKRQTQQQQLLHIETLLDLRGGAKRDEISLEEDSSNSSPILLTKLRNVIRSVLKIADKNVPTIGKTLRSILKSLETVLGVDLLPKTPKKKKSKKNKKTKKQSASSVKEQEESVKEEETLKEKKMKTKQKPTATTQKHLSQKISTTNPNYRIQRELKEFIKEPPPNLTVKVGKNIRVWIVTMKGTKGSIYEGEVFKLRISFPQQYPTVPPSVYFLPPNIPKHEHVYTNGDICLSLLGKDWRPTMTAQSIANSILSILSSAQSKSIPMDNAKHAHNKPGQYQEDWVYHDDNC